MAQADLFDMRIAGAIAGVAADCWIEHWVASVNFIMSSPVAMRDRRGARIIPPATYRRNGLFQTMRLRPRNQSPCKVLNRQSENTTKSASSKTSFCWVVAGDFAAGPLLNPSATHHNMRLFRRVVKPYKGNMRGFSASRWNITKRIFSENRRTSADKCNFRLQTSRSHGLLMLHHGIDLQKTSASVEHSHKLRNP